MSARCLLCLGEMVRQFDQFCEETMPGWEIRHVSTPAAASRELDGGDYLVGLLVYDRRSHSLDHLGAFLRTHNNVFWIGIFAQGDLENSSCRDLIGAYMYDFHTCPVDWVRLAHTLGHAWGNARMYRAVHRPAPAAHLSSLIGACDAIVRLRIEVERAARVTAPVLLWGESGTGKELAAQAIHAQSARAGGPFIPINCGAIPSDLAQAELFGYERGAFTGAVHTKAGLIEAADGGTLFLDEIGDLPIALQANLLRFLQEKTICRLGSHRLIHIDARVIAASHLQLEAAVAEGTFRQDLYFRLAVLPLTVPALRERGRDLITLAEHFFSIYESETSSKLQGFSSAAVSAILEHRWPGNVRELINRVRRALVMSDGPKILPEDMGLGVCGTQIKPAPVHRRSMCMDRSMLCNYLDRNGQNLSRAARDLGVSRTTLYRLMRKFQLNRCV